jgi:hypothetical protein
MKTHLRSRISYAALLLSAGALGGCALHDDARLTSQSPQGGSGEAYLAFAAGTSGSTLPGGIALNSASDSPLPPNVRGKRKSHPIGEKDPEFERKLAAIRANPEAREALALRGGFIIPLVAIVAIILGILAATNNDNKMATDASQHAQTGISLQSPSGLPGQDKDNATPEQLGNVRSEALNGHPR